MPRSTTNETTSVQPSLQGELRELVEQQTELGQRLVALAMRAETKIEDLKIQMQTCAAELGEARVELAKLRAAHEIEMRMRATAEARVVRLKAKIATIGAECADLDEENDAGPVIQAPAGTDLEPTAPGTDPVVESLGLTETDLAAVDVLVRRGEAPDRKEMLRTFVRRGLAAGGLRADGSAPRGAVHGEAPRPPGADRGSAALLTARHRDAPGIQRSAMSTAPCPHPGNHLPSSLSMPDSAVRRRARALAATAGSRLRLAADRAAEMPASPSPARSST